MLGFCLHRFSVSNSIQGNNRTRCTKWRIAIILQRNSPSFPGHMYSSSRLLLCEGVIAIVKEVEEAFRQLLYGEGAWLGLILIVTTIMLTSYKNKYLSLVFIPITLFIGISYLDNVASNNNLTWMALVMFITTIFLLIQLAKR